MQMDYANKYLKTLYGGYTFDNSLFLSVSIHPNLRSSFFFFRDLRASVSSVRNFLLDSLTETRYYLPMQRIVSEKEQKNKTFFLTLSPICSILSLSLSLSLSL